ncbi:MAG TPA: glycosyltransferase family 4 protein, partial [Streptosporangiaceae bacterium]
ILPSRTEAFGMVLIEAMASGLPVVASRVGGIPEVVRDGETGFLAEPGDVAGFAGQIGQLFDDSALWQRFNENGRQAAGTRDWPAQVQRTADFAEGMISMRQGTTAPARPAPGPPPVRPA